RHPRYLGPTLRDEPVAEDQDRAAAEGHAQECQREQAAMPERARVASWKRPEGSQTTGEERRECHVTGPSASNTTPFENRIVAAVGRNGSVQSDRRGCVSQRVSCSRKRERASLPIPKEVCAIWREGPRALSRRTCSSIAP